MLNIAKNKVLKPSKKIIIKESVTEYVVEIVIIKEMMNTYIRCQSLILIVLVYMFGSNSLLLVSFQNV